MNFMKITLCLLALLALPTLAIAQEGQPYDNVTVVSAAQTQEKSLGFDIQVIYAKKAEKLEIQSDLNALQTDLTSGFQEYRSFQLLQKSYQVITPNRVGSLVLPNSPATYLTLKYIPTTDPNLYSVDLLLNADRVALLQLSPNSTFFQAGLPYEDGILIMAITLAKVIEIN